uniref:Nucleolar protein 10 n=1 Tax=Monodelphis domestica TaxID=13616 RepID=A0A5F8GQE7_MONDO
MIFLQYYLNEQGGKAQSLKKTDTSGQQTCSAHTVTFSPVDKYSTPHHYQEEIQVVHFFNQCYRLLKLK